MEILELLDKNPFEILKIWMEEAKAHPSIKEPTAMVLSTVDSHSFPCSRVVLVKEITQTSLIFYTNTKSQKGKHLAQNANCSLLFYWDPLFRQVKLQGKTQLIPREKTIKYWESRSRESQLSQWISKQSTPVESREILISKIEEAKKQFIDQSIPCPEDWSGYSVSIQRIEFWQGRDHRLHDRFLFSKVKDKTWNIQRLYP